MKVVEGHWVTINGTHVFIGGNGRVQKGPKNLLGMTKEGVEEKSKNKYARPDKNIHGGRGVEKGFYRSDEEHRIDIKRNVKEYKAKKKSESIYQEIRKERENIHPMLQKSFSQDLSALLGTEAFKTPKDVADFTKSLHKEVSKGVPNYNKSIGPRPNSSRPLSAARTGSNTYNGKANTGNANFDQTVADCLARGRKLPKYFE